MPFPGGRLGAGHYIPGGAQSAIFLRSTSAFYNKEVDGSPFTVTAPARDADDTLFFLKAGVSQSLVAPAGWTALPSYANGQLQLFTRLATDTAADDFLVDEGANTRNFVGQMAVIGNTLGETTLLSNYQGGIINNNVGGAGDTVWNMLQMFADGTPEANDLVLAIYMRQRNFGVNLATAEITAPSILLNNIGGIAVNKTTAPVSRLFCGWQWQDEENNSPLIPGADITYEPIEDFSVETLQMLRFRYP